MPVSMETVHMATPDHLPQYNNHIVLTEQESPWENIVGNCILDKIYLLSGIVHLVWLRGSLALCLHSSCLLYLKFLDKPPIGPSVIQSSPEWIDLRCTMFRRSIISSAFSVIAP